MKKRILFITCEEAQHICDKTQYNEATLLERLKLSIRLSWCRITRAYTKRNRALTNIVKTSNVDCLKDDERKDLQNRFEEELKKQN